MSKSKAVRAIVLGDRVKDRVSGFTGIVVCMNHWLNGCIRVGVAAEKTESGKVVDEVHFDLSQLVIVKAGVHKLPMLKAAPEPHLTPGGPAREGRGFRQPN